MNNNLQNMFKKAKSQPPLISEDELSNLLNQKLSQKNNLLQKFKGVPTMFKLSFAVAIATITGLISLNFLEDDSGNQFIAEAPEVTNQQNIVQESNITTSQNLTENKISKDETGSKETANIKETTNHNSQMEQKSLFSPVDIKGVHIIQLSPEDLKKAGILKNTNEKFIVFKEPFGEHNRICSLYVDGTFKVCNENDNPDFISPKLITDNNGNKRYFKINLGNATISNAVYNKKTSNRNGNRNIMENKMIMTIENSSQNLPLYYLKPDDNNELLNDKDSLKFKKHQIIINALNTGLKNLYKNDVDSIILEDMVSKHFQNDTIENNLKQILLRLDSIKNNSNFSFDSLLKSHNNDYEQIFLSLDSTFKNSKSINIDSLFKTLDINFDIDFDNLSPNNIKFKIQTTIVDSLETSASGGLIIKRIISDSSANSSPIKPIQIFNNNFNIDNLIPIEINMGKVDIDNELINKENFSFILWFEPDEKLLEILPKDIKNKLSDELKELMQLKNVCEQTAIAGKDPMLDTWRSCSGAIENLTIFPNPVSQNATIKFNLNNKRNITVTLHDVNGNILAKLMNNKDLNPDEYSFNFNMTNYQSGIYLISIQSDQGEIAVQRMVVEK